MEFKHEALHDSAAQIRLVSIQPEGVDDELSVTLQIESRDAGIDYDALSYVWGDTTLKESISVNGLRFQVTRNLRNALCRLRADMTRSSDFAGRLWVDALCIDQEAVEERNAQVRAMHNVFQTAQTVWVWLGRDFEEEDRSIHNDPDIWRIERDPTDFTLSEDCIFDKAYYLLRSTYRWPATANIGHGGGGRRFKIPGPDPCNDIDAWAQLSRLFKRAWFQRLWIVQELVLSKSVYLLWGTKQCTVPWSLFLKASKAIADPKHWGTYKFSPQMGIEHVIALEPQRFPKDDILTALYQTRGAHSTDPRDKLFGMLGMYTDDVDCVVDYNSPLEAVATQWACRRIMRTKTLDVLHLCAGPESSTLRSWAPDLRKSWADDRNLFILSRKARPLDLACSMTVQDSMALQVYRLDLGQVEEIGTTCAVSPTSHSALRVAHDVLKAIKDWERMVVEALGLHDGSETAFLSALFRDYVYWTGDGEKEELRQMYKQWRAFTRLDVSTLREQQFDTQVDNEMNKTLFQFTHRCQMFLYNENQIGVAAASLGVRKTDHVVLLHGAHTPYILRDAEANQFQVLGPCFVSGYMQEMKYSGLGLYPLDKTVPLLTQRPRETLLR